MPLDRVLENEAMDSAAEALEYDTMDHAAVNQRFVDDFLAFCPEPGDVLDLGTGTAQIPVVLCRRHKGCRVMALDAAVAMLEQARYNVEAASLAPRVTLCHGDAKGLSFPDRMFAAVISNSIVHHVPEPGPVFAEAVRVTAPGAALFFRDLLRPESLGELTSLVDLHAAGANEFQRKMFADSLHAALTLDEVRDLVGALGFAAETVRATSDRHWTWAARKPETVR